MDTNTNNRAGVVGTILVLLIIVIGAGVYLYYNKAEAPSQQQVEVRPGVGASSNCGLTVESPLVGSSVKFPLTVSGKIDNTNAEKIGCSWTMFEGQAGVAMLHYQTKDGWSLPVDVQPVPVENWMSPTTNFSVDLNFDNSVLLFPSGYNFKIVISEDNPSGESVVDTVEVPVVLQ